MAAKEPPKQDIKSSTLTDIRALARVLRQYDLTELEVERGDERIRLCRLSESAGGLVSVVGAPASAPQTVAPSSEKTADVKDDHEIVTSPFVGTFYRAPGPDADPFVEVGQTVSKGKTLCIVEAMKLMNEIEAESDFKVVEILVKNAEVVEFAQPLFRVLPT